MKIGIECEGRFKGVKTLFLDASEYRPFIREPRSYRIVETVGQVYISDLENELDLDDVGQMSASDKTKIITVERTALFQAPHANVHVILRVLNSSFALLRSSDQIKFEPVTRLTYMVTKEQMVTSRPQEYEGDVVIAKGAR